MLDKASAKKLGEDKRCGGLGVVGFKGVRQDRFAEYAMPRIQPDRCEFSFYSLEEKCRVLRHARTLGDRASCDSTARTLAPDRSPFTPHPVSANTSGNLYPSA